MGFNINLQAFKNKKKDSKLITWLNNSLASHNREILEILENKEILDYSLTYSFS